MFHVERNGIYSRKCWRPDLFHVERSQSFNAGNALICSTWNPCRYCCVSACLVPSKRNHCNEGGIEISSPHVTPAIFLLPSTYSPPAPRIATHTRADPGQT